MEHLFYAFVLLIVAASHVEAAPPVRPPETCTEYGVDSPTCTANVLGGLGSLQRCIQASFPNDCGFTEDTTALVTVDRVPKCTYYYDGENYAKARAAAHGDNLPFAVMYAESEDDAVKFLNCAVQNGYPVSARGRGHSYQGLSTMHGHVIIDMSLTCKPDEFVIDRTGGDHILPGQRYLATIQVQPGCTNAVMLAAAYKNFTAEEGALALIGSCPSVGITGFLLGGGTGDVAPYTGWMVDLLEEARVILYNGTVVTTSREENPDLFWALRGGGSGNGIVSSLTLRIVEAPEPLEAGKPRKTSLVDLNFYEINPDVRRNVLGNVSNFFFDVDPTLSSKFGSSVQFTREKLFMGGAYLGSIEDFVQDISKTGLLDDSLYKPIDEPFSVPSGFNSTIFRSDNDGNVKVVCGEFGAPAPCDIDFLPPAGVVIWEFDDYARMEAYKTCYSGILRDPTIVRSTNDWCADLEIERRHCTNESLADFVSTTFFQEYINLGVAEVDPTLEYHYPICENGAVLDAIIERGGNPESFLNRHGPSPYWLSFLNPPPYGLGLYPDGLASLYSPTRLGSVLLPELSLDTLVELSNSELGIISTHLQHGAPMTIPVNATALPWRDTPMLVEFNDNAQKAEFLDILVQDPVYDGNTSKLQAYYNYLGPYTPNWRTLYFGDHYEMLQQIRCSNDPVNVFGKPLTVELCEEGHATEDMSALGPRN